jgi:hypothetical protein
MNPKKYPPGKLILADVRKAIYNWVKRETEGQVESTSIIWRDQGEPLPPRPAVALKITSGPLRTGYSDNLGVNQTTGKTTVGGQRVLVVSVQLFGSRSDPGSPRVDQVAADLNASLSKPAVLLELRKSGVAVFNQGEVTNLSDVEETEFEERAEFSVMLGVAENQVDDPGYFTEIGPIGATIAEDP